ncbi:hypothetical protein GOP47_0005283 [Adiantum capillus-veneris]|uniref:NADPH-dependent diflavin oxidoreductase 1 n=1 Tax=Adiantum capillus-veneris TaxID=13818 RepID=A0A9D4V587_ADICA|nr:hypothetical protein GOP47_0005283 [Adiantum capillus-veneris]
MWCLLVTVGKLESEKLAIFIVSTTGQGDPPDMMKIFWKFLLRRSLSTAWLKSLKFAVFGLGDSGYLQYNVVGKKLDRRLHDLGGMPIIERGLGDDQHPSGYEASLDPWLVSLWTAMASISGRPYALHTLSYDNLALDRPKYNIIICKTSSEVSTRKVGDLEEVNRAVRMLDSADAMHGVKETVDFSVICPRNPYLARMVCNKRLTRNFSEREVHHIEFDLGSSGLTYEPGDALAVMPSQSEVMVDAFMNRCCLDPDSIVLVQAASKQNDFWQGDSNMNKPVTVRTLVQSVMDIASASPRRYFLEVMSHFATAEHEKERLRYFVSPEGRDDLYQYNQRERRTVLEVLEDFPSVQLPLEWLLQLVPRLQPRLFSISSSLIMHPNQVHITVAVQKWRTPLKRTRHGLCSTWLSCLEPQKGEIYVPIWCKKGLKFPDASMPLLLVGPGTGCAPFRALIEERVAMSVVSGVAPIMFFFGCRQEQDDFLYKDFWLAQAEDSGVLSTTKGGGFFAAFSRDQPRKVYVQHKIEEYSAKVWAMLQSGCAVYVAGSAVKMPADVFAALEKVVMKEGCQSEDAARKWLKHLERVGRYHVEAW